MTPRDRFLRKITINPTTGCWEWHGAWGWGGYGVFKLGKMQTSHRASYQIFKGEIPKGLWVLHKCDVRKCVNPDHLFLGTCSDNTIDKLSKGRGYFTGGENNGQAKLTEENIREIRSSSLLQKELAEKFSVWPSAISRIKSGLRWKHL